MIDASEPENLVYIPHRQQLAARSKGHPMPKKTVARVKNASTKHSATTWVVIAGTTVSALIVAAVVAARRES
jgi:hypothetical protein